MPGVPLPELPESAGAAGWMGTLRSRLPRYLMWATLLFVAMGAWYGWRGRSAGAGAPAAYRTARLATGNITQTVSATGPLSAISTVNVGSQVSGNIAKLHVDFNDRVTAGQLIAEIDPSTYEAQLVQAEGDLLSARVALELKRLNAQRSENLHASNLISRADHDQVLAELRQQEALVTIKEAVVKSARVDLERTKIRSPINGVVIDRAIDIGQTVQASFAAPTLFVLAQDLSQMQITANVSEADIGGVAAEKPVTFTVDAFPGENFSGRVRQVRNNTTTTNNVVTYPTIITVDNPDLKLRPGMTANVTIVVARRENVLRAPNAALRFRPADAPRHRTDGSARCIGFLVTSTRTDARPAPSRRPPCRRAWPTRRSPRSCPACPRARSSSPDSRSRPPSRARRPRRLPRAIPSCPRCRRAGNVDRPWRPSSS